VTREMATGRRDLRQRQKAQTLWKEGSRGREGPEEDGASMARVDIPQEGSLRRLKVDVREGVACFSQRVPHSPFIPAHKNIAPFISRNKNMMEQCNLPAFVRPREKAGTIIRAVSCGCRCTLHFLCVRARER